MPDLARSCEQRPDIIEPPARDRIRDLTQVTADHPERKECALGGCGERFEDGVDSSEVAGRVRHAEDGLVCDREQHRVICRPSEEQRSLGVVTEGLGVFAIDCRNNRASGEPDRLGPRRPDVVMLALGRLDEPLGGRAGAGEAHDRS